MNTRTVRPPAPPMTTVSVYCSPWASLRSTTPYWMVNVFARSVDVVLVAGLYSVWPVHELPVQAVVGRIRSALPVSKSTANVWAGVPTVNVPCHRGPPEVLS